MGRAQADGRMQGRGGECGHLCRFVQRSGAVPAVLYKWVLGGGERSGSDKTQNAVGDARDRNAGRGGPSFG